MVRRMVSVALIMGLLCSFSVFAESFRVADLQVEKQADSYSLDAQIEYQLSDEAREALENGVPLTLEVHLQLRRDGAWVWESDITNQRLRYQIRYQALGDVYQVSDLQSGAKQNFSTEASALKTLGKLSNLSLVGFDQLTQGEQYNLAVRTRLDIEALPLPLRPIAYIDAGWRLQSEWMEWRLTH